MKILDKYFEAYLRGEMALIDIAKSEQLPLWFIDRKMTKYMREILPKKQIEEKIKIEEDFCGKMNDPYYTQSLIKKFN